MPFSNKLINLRSVDLNLLTVFDAIYSEMNISRASDNIGMSQSAMSHALSRLRVMLDDELFIRSGNAFTPTIRARELAGPIQQSLQGIATAIMGGMEFDCCNSDRTFNIVLGDVGEISILPALLEKLNDLNASVKLKVLNPAVKEVDTLLKNGELDLMFTHRPVFNDDIELQTAYLDSCGCLLNSSHPVISDTLDMNAYLKSSHVALELVEDEIPVVDGLLHTQGLSRNIALSIHNIHAIPWLVKSTDLLATLPMLLASRYASDFDLKLFPLPFELELPFYLMWKKGLSSDEGGIWLRELVLELCAKLYIK